MFLPLCAKPATLKMLARESLLERAIRQCLTRGGGSNGKLIIFIADGDVMTKVSIYIKRKDGGKTCKWTTGLLQSSMNSPELIWKENTTVARTRVNLPGAKVILSYLSKLIPTMILI